MSYNLLESAMAMALLPLSVSAQTETSPVAPPVAGCDAMEIGPVYGASLDNATTMACFQFVAPDVPERMKVDVNLAGLRAGEVHDVSLVRVDADGTTSAAASDASVDAFRVLQAIGNASTRWLLLIGRPTPGAFEPFQMQVTTASGADGHEPNDAVTHATKLHGNQRVEGNLDNVGDIDNYLISFRPEQAEATVELEAPTDVVGDVIDGANWTGILEPGKRLRIDTSRPVFIRVRGDANTIGARYTFALRDPTAMAVVTAVRSGVRTVPRNPGSRPSGYLGARIRPSSRRWEVQGNG